MKPILKLKSDAVFKRLFGDPRNAHILKKFVSVILDIPTQDINKFTIIDPSSKIVIADYNLKKDTKEYHDIFRLTSKKQI